MMTRSGSIFATSMRVGTFVACGDADDVFFDAKRHRIYVSCGDGTGDASGYRHLSPVKTVRRAHTSLFAPDLDRLYVPARAGFFGLGSDAAILVLQPVD